MNEIAKYKLGWQAVTNQMRIDVEFVDGKLDTVPVNSPEEFIAVALLLTKAPVAVDSHGDLHG